MKQALWEFGNLGKNAMGQTSSVVTAALREWVSTGVTANTTVNRALKTLGKDVQNFYNTTLPQISDIVSTGATSIEDDITSTTSLMETEFTTVATNIETAFQLARQTAVG
jgi:hypothetical protein